MLLIDVKKKTPQKIRRTTANAADGSRSKKVGVVVLSNLGGVNGGVNMKRGNRYCLGANLCLLLAGPGHLDQHIFDF